MVRLAPEHFPSEDRRSRTRRADRLIHHLWDLGRAILISRRASDSRRRSTSPVVLIGRDFFGDGVLVNAEILFFNMP
jgi:hypothetical protein